MTPEEFVKAFKEEKENQLEMYFNKNEETSVSDLLKKLNLNNSQLDSVKEIIDTVLTDSYYSILLGLDGCSSIGNIQETYSIKDEKGNELTGDLEGIAYELFQE